MAGSLSRFVAAGLLLALTGVPVASAQTPVFCEDGTHCATQQACVGGICADRSNTRVEMLFPLALARIVDERTGKRTGKLVREVDRLLRWYLDFSGYFRLLPGDRNPAGAGLETLRPTTIDFQSWWEAGAWAVVKGRVRATAAGKLELELQLWRVEEAATVPLKRTIQTLSGEEDLKEAVVSWVDEVTQRYGGGLPFLNHRIAFSYRVKKGGPKNIGVMDIDGGNQRFLTNDDSINMLPAWTADGRVAWTSFMEHNPDLWLDGKKFSGHPRMNTGVAFFKDGKRAAITLSKDDNPEIYLLHAGTGKIRKRLTRHPGIDTSPAWSTDGKRLAFVSDRATGRPQIFTMGSDGSNQVRARQVGGYNSSPDWSPVDDIIIYSAMAGGERYDLYAIHLAAGEVRRLTDAGSNEEPTFSRNGRFIVFSSTAGGSQAIWIMRANGSQKRRISRGEGIFMTPAWQR
ncbi:MAG: TolB protein [Myxococcota bacterium]|jgi:TolB protein